jgi:hypothetical protein
MLNRRIVADDRDELGNVGAEHGLQLVTTDVRVLEGVVQDRCGDDLVGVSGAIEQRCDLEQVEDDGAPSAARRWPPCRLPAYRTVRGSAADG